MQTTPDYQGRCNSTINPDTGAASDATCVLSPAQAVFNCSYNQGIDCTALSVQRANTSGLAQSSFMLMSDPGDTYGEPDDDAADFMAGAIGACTLSHPKEAAISHGPVFIDDDLQWIDEKWYSTHTEMPR